MHAAAAKEKSQGEQEILAALGVFNAGAALSKHRCVDAGGEQQQNSPRRGIGQIPCIRAGLKQSPVPPGHGKTGPAAQSAAAFWGYPRAGGGRLGKQG